jgi:hypothetical protein
MLRVVPDREVAKEAARLNVSALVAGQPRIVFSDGRFSVDKLRVALGRGGEDLSAVRRAVSCLLDRAAPAIERCGSPACVTWGPSDKIPCRCAPTSRQRLVWVRAGVRGNIQNYMPAAILSHCATATSASFPPPTYNVAPAAVNRTRQRTAHGRLTRQTLRVARRRS